MPHMEWWALSEAQRTKICEERQKQKNNVRTAAAKEREQTVPVAQGVTFAPNTYPPANDSKVSVVDSRHHPSKSNA
jgi:hypothetical protein